MANDRPSRSPPFPARRRPRNPFGTDHHYGLVFSPIEDDSEVELAGQVEPFFNQDLTDKAARRSGLRRHQAAAKYLTRMIFRLLG